LTAIDRDLPLVTFPWGTSGVQERWPHGSTSTPAE
jgi:hypothetical protein